MHTSSWADQRIIFVSGKGGVGKSLIAAAVAQELARMGKRVLLAEIGESSYYRDYWQLPTVDHVPRLAPGGFDLALWSGDSCLHEYVLHYFKVERLYRLFFENKVMRALVNVAPGLNEIAILGKITSGIRNVGPELRYDTIVVDCYATGHALSLLMAPKGMTEAIQFGPMGSHSREIQRVICDPKLCRYLVVTLLEELPVAETLEFVTSLRRELGVEADVIANRVLQPPVSSEKIEILADLTAPAEQAVAEFARHVRGVLHRQAEMLKTLLNSGVHGEADSGVHGEADSGVHGEADSSIRLLEVPLILSTDPQELVTRAGEALRDALKPGATP